MSNDKSEATYHGHLDENHPTTDSITVGPGHAIVDGQVVSIEPQVVKTPQEPGRYELLTSDGHKWVKVAEVTVAPKGPNAELIGRWIGAGVCIAVVAAGLLIGVRYLISWLWGV